MIDERKVTIDPSTGKPSRKGCQLFFVVSLITLFGIAVIYIGLVMVGGILIVADPVEQVDAVVVLSGDDGDRLALAIEMHEKGLAPNLVITDTTNAANRRLRNEAIAAGFPEENIYVTDLQVDSTADEALAVRELSLREGWGKLMIVTDPYHSFRTRLVFRRAFLATDIEIIVRPVVGHWFRSSTWFFHPEGWQVVFLEIGKLINYLFIGL